MKYKAGQIVHLTATKPGTDGKHQIVTVGGRKREYEVINSGNKYSKLRCIDNNAELRVENTRVRPREEQGGIMATPKTAKTTPTATAKPKAKAKAKPKAKQTVRKASVAAKIERVSLKGFKKDGHEVWTRDFSDGFNSERSDGKKIRAQSVCVIDKSKKKCKHFNMFDGTLGRVQVGARAKRKDKKTKKMIETVKQFGTDYDISDYDRKIKELKKKGYKRYTAAV